MNNNIHVGTASGPNIPGDWQLVGVADFNLDGHPDFVLYNSSTHQTSIWVHEQEYSCRDGERPKYPWWLELGHSLSDL